MKSKSGPPRGSKNASKGGRDAHLTLRLPANLKAAIADCAEARTALGCKQSSADVANEALRRFVIHTFPKIAEKHGI